jgi:hypothetical protein
MRRILAAMIASVTALLLTATVAPADARDAREATLAAAERTDADSTPVADRAALRLTIRAKIVNGTRLKIWGTAPRWRRKPVLLQRRPLRGGAWKTVDRDRTTLRGAYEFRSAPVPSSSTCRNYVFRTKVKSRRYLPSPVTQDAYHRC